MVDPPPPARIGAEGSPDPLGLPEFLWLFALLSASVFLILEPLIGFPVFGSDTGEYFRLSQSVALTGHLPGGAYGGWGSAYPDFPGLFVLVATISGATGASVFSALTIAVPVITAFSVLPLFLLFRRLFPHDGVAILGAAIATFAFPRIFSIAHPAPLAIGDFLVVAALWMFVEGRRDARWYLPLALTSGALVVTHHLSSYFFVLGALGSLFLLELWRPGSWSRRFPTRELVFLGAFLGVLFADWALYAQSFLGVASGGSFDGGPRALLILEPTAVAAVLVSGLLIRWRRGSRTHRLRVSFPSDRSFLRDFALLLAAAFGGALLLLLVPLPGTDQTTTATAVVFFAPTLALACFAAGTRRLVTASRIAPFALAWLAAVGLSALVAIATSNPTVSAGRHAEYLMIPFGLLAAISLGRLVARAGDRSGRRAVVAGGVAVVLLLSANAAVAYPPPALFGGFQEGLTTGDAALWTWVGLGLPPAAVVASDHRLSSMIFGFDGNPATWDSTPALFTGSNWSQAASELRGSLAPHAPLPIDAVAVDGTMAQGVALDPSQLAVPMSPEAAAWLSGPPFVPIYENGPQVVYWVAGPIGPAG
ncbi:MAG TPA: hypothetical protein VLY85_01750 [Thermoplasmata archaeon]|nr:hypothetical protein [Thermoplasmata archaeon]